VKFTVFVFSFLFQIVVHYTEWSKSMYVFGNSFILVHKTQKYETVNSHCFVISNNFSTHLSW